MSNKKKRGRIGGFFKDFKAFITKGNILDLAIAVIIGGAFGAIVSSLVNDIIMPLISLAVGGKSVKDWKWVITPAEIVDGVEVTAESALMYGNFIQTIIDFLIIALFIFIALRLLMSVKTRLAKQETGEFVYEKAQRKAIAKQLRAEGKSRAQIEDIIEGKEKAETARLKAEEEAKKAEEEANNPESEGELLGQIRDLLKEISVK